jgi:hypothetical protein
MEIKSFRFFSELVAERNLSLHVDLCENYSVFTPIFITLNLLLLKRTTKKTNKEICAFGK